MQGRNARLFKDGVVVGYGNISVKASAELIKEHCMDPLTPYEPNGSICEV